MNENTLHVYGQNCQHDEVIITGTKDALLRLAEALKLCAEKNVPFYVSSFAADGEGFDLLISPATHAELAELAYPYFGQTAMDRNPKRIQNFDSLCSKLYEVLSANKKERPDDSDKKSR